VIEGKIKTVTVSSEANQYFASINYEDGLKEVNGVNNGKTIALDMGITVFATSSENEQIKPNYSGRKTRNKKYDSREKC